MANVDQFPALFERLKSILQARAGHLRELDNLPEKYSLQGPYLEQFKKDVWFGMVEVRKNYVSYHLMPVYMYPDLLEGISDGLKKRMQGKSCFNFTKIDEPLFQELDELTGRCIARFRQGENR
jgi:hypothetical protein